MTIGDLGIPKARRRIKGRPEPAVVVAPDVEFGGDELQSFVTDILVPTARYTGDQLKEFRYAKQIVGKVVPDKDLGDPFGAAFGRYWYAVK